MQTETMELIKFKDKCIITRSQHDENGNPIYNEYDEPIMETVYEGDCSFQAGGQTSLSIVVRNDQVYLPSNDVMIYAGDVIDIETARGRKRHGVVSTARDIEMPLTHGLLTKIEIKQGTGE